MTLSQLADDLYQLRLPLPFALNHVNVYLLRGEAGWTIVDCGINTAQGRAGWVNAFDELAITPADIEQIVLTHVHPDHFGMSGWLQQQAEDAGRDVPILASSREIELTEQIWRSPRFDFGAWLASSGMPDDFVTQVAGKMTDTHGMTLPHPPQMQALAANTPVRFGNRTLTPMHAPGHSDGQLIFYDPETRWLLSGDHVLMKITPNIGLWEHSDANPLGAFIESLHGLKSLDVAQALPGHRRIITDWAGRIEELIAHHDERLGFVMAAVSDGAQTAYDVTGKIFTTGRFTPHEWRFAIAETLAHLDYLEREGKLMHHPDNGRYQLV